MQNSFVIDNAEKDQIDYHDTVLKLILIVLLGALGASGCVWVHDGTNVG